MKKIISLFLLYPLVLCGTEVAQHDAIKGRGNRTGQLNARTRQGKRTRSNRMKGNKNVTFRKKIKVFLKKSLSHPIALPFLSLALVVSVLGIYKLSNQDSDQGGDNPDQGKKSHPDPPPPEKLERLPVGRLNLDELQKYTGENKSRILMSICGRIFDLTKAKDFYGYPDGPYNCFTGADASYMLGAMSLDKKDQNKKEFEQDDKHQRILGDWITKYRAKYPIVGRLDGFEDLCPESWNEARNDDIVDENLRKLKNLKDIYGKIDDNEDLGKITMDELKATSKHDNDKWLSILGVVFNVKSAEIVYEDAIGHDISLALAKNEWQEETYNKSVQGLQEGEIKNLKIYLKKFLETYPVVGILESEKFKMGDLNLEEEEKSEDSDAQNEEKTKDDK